MISPFIVGKILPPNQLRFKQDDGENHLQVDRPGP